MRGCAAVSDGGGVAQNFRETVNTFRTVARTKHVQHVARDHTILNPYNDATFVPAAGGGWRWSYCVRTAAAE